MKDQLDGIRVSLMFLCAMSTIIAVLLYQILGKLWL
jgi:hypothetical protein